MATSQRQLESVVIELLPAQGGWNEEPYPWLTDHSTRPIEFSDGFAVEALGGSVLVAPLQPQQRYWAGTDLVLEIVSAGRPERDHVERQRVSPNMGSPSRCCAR